MREGHSTEGFPATETHNMMPLILSRVVSIVVSVQTDEELQVRRLPVRVKDVTLFVLLWVKQHDHTPKTQNKTTAGCQEDLY